jgi:putative oxygen-independent coproporphyrinogen III oxidase
LSVRGTVAEHVLPNKRFGVYVHIPFCAARCDYCDFATWTDRAHLIEAYVGACVTDLERRARRAELPAATSVFFGGGTPSLIPAADLIRILDAIPRTTDAEVTVECNPDTVDAGKLRAYRAGGVNRLSFGVQSMRSHVLAALGRTHDPANVTRAVHLARAAGFERLNLDLIYGTPGETPADWRATLAGALALEPSHVSAYALTVEPATPLGRRVAAGSQPGPDDDDQADKYVLADELLTACGLEWYEISNWARPGFECRHNQLYWAQGEYVGIGCAAHGHTGGRRWWNVRPPEHYIERVRSGAAPEAGAEHLDAFTRDEEHLGLALRTRAGVAIEELARTGADSAADELVHAGLLTAEGSRRVLTLRGRLLATDVTARLLAAAAPLAVSSR